MDRTALELELNRSRDWLLEAFAAMSAEDLARGVTASEHDPSVMWTPKDHLSHLAGIELNFVRMVRRHLEGDTNPVALRQDDSGRERSREEIMASVHAFTEGWAEQHRASPLGDIIALGARARAATLQLMSELSDAQLAERLPGAPWADGTIGGVLATNAAHGKMHWTWMKEGFERLGLTPPAGAPSR
jgi:hypothetical protein